MKAKRCFTNRIPGPVFSAGAEGNPGTIAVVRDDGYFVL
jgi:hypothetical protein